jgi:Mrp family chromosome partitioning ATPase
VSVAELLASTNTKDVLRALNGLADFVLIDSAPVLASADTLSLAEFVDGVLIVADAARATMSAVHETCHRLEQVGAKIIGAVLNKADPAHARWDEYYGYTTYTSHQELPRQRQSARGGWSA